MHSIRYRMEMASESPKGRDQWVDAAYARFTSNGLRAVRVESLARDLGTSKGSFYWHFTDRAELVATVMRRWEELETEQIIAITATKGTSLERIEALFTTVGSRLGARGGERTLYVDAESEGVAEIVARVSKKRIDYLGGLLVDCGVEPGEAERRSVLALAIAVGLQQLSAGLAVPSDPALGATGVRMVIS